MKPPRDQLLPIAEKLLTSGPDNLLGVPPSAKASIRKLDAEGTRGEYCFQAKTHVFGIDRCNS